MNMDSTSGRGRVLGSKEASSHASGELPDPAHSGMTAATRGRARGDAKRPLWCRTPNLVTSPTRERRRVARARRTRTPAALLWAVVALFATPALAHADLLTATVSNQQTNVLEGTAAVFTVTLTGGTSSQAVTVDFTVSGTAKPNIADNPGDYEVPDQQATGVTGPDGTGNVACDADSATCSGRLSIAAGVRSATITITAERDPTADLLEGAETLTVTLTGATTTAGAVTLGTPSAATTTIIDYGTVTVSVADLVADSAVDEGAEATLSVTLSGPLSEDLTIGYATEDRSAVAGADYTDVDSQLVIAAGSTSGMITVDTLEDTVEEDNETFAVSLSDADLPDNVALGQATAITTIDDGNTLEVGVEVPDSVAEGSTVVFTVKLIGGTGSGAVAVTYTLSVADPEVDYEAPPGTTVDTTANTVVGKLVIPVGAKSGTITIQTIADPDTDAAENLVLTLSDPTTDAGDVGLNTGLTAATTVIRPSDTVTVSVADATVTEGLRAVFGVTLSGPVANATTVAYYTSDGTATSDASAPPVDFAAVAQTAPRRLTIAAGSTSGSITVGTLEDDRAEDAETFTVTLPTLPTDAANAPNVALGRSTATATINDNDPLTASVASDQVTAIEEGDTATFTVSLAGGGGSEAVVVRYTVTGTATPVDDYTVPTGDDVTTFDGGYSALLTISANTRTGQISITTPTDDDNVLETDETLKVTLTKVTSEAGVVALGSPAEATAIIGPSSRTVTVAIAAPTQTNPNDGLVAEGAVAQFPVSLTGAVAVDLTVGYTTINGTTTSADYSSQSRGTLTIKAGETAATIDVLTVDDNLEEENETFSVRLSLSNQPANVFLGTTEAQATITDGETLGIGITGPAHVAAGQTATYKVALTGGVGSENVVVSYSVSGTPGTDYTPPSNVLTIARGRSTGTIQIRTLAGATATAVTVTLDQADTLAGSLQTPDPSSAETTIQTADTPIVSIADARVTEGGVASFAVSVSGGTSTDPMTVGYSVAPVAPTTTADYTGAATGTVIIAARGRSARITVQTLEDRQAEGDDTFTVTLTTVPAGVQLGTAVATGTITDNDTLTVSVGGPTAVSEGATATFTVSVAGATSTAAVNVHYEVGGTATETDDCTATPVTGDYAPPASPLTIPLGVSTGTIPIPTCADDLLEGHETLSLTLTEVTTTAGRVTVGSPSEASTTIFNHGTATALPESRAGNEIVTVAIAAPTNDGVVAESAVARFPVSLTGAVAVDLTVGYTTVNGTATSADYSSQSRGTLTIKAGEIAATIDVLTVDDNLEEENETFSVRLSLSNQPANVFLGTTEAQATITDGETLGIGITGPANVAAGQTATYKVALTGGVGSENVVVSYSVSGTPGTDYTPPSNVLTIARGRSTGTIQIRTLAGATATAVTVTLDQADTLAGSLQTPDPSSAETTIQTADTPIVSIADARVTEGGVASFAVSVSGGTSTDPMTVGYSVAPVAPTTTADYTGAATGTVIIAARGRSARITVQTLEDRQAEGDDTFTVTLTTVPAGVQLGTAVATGTITDNDTLTVSVGGPTAVSEGATATFTVSVAGATSTAAVNVHYEVGGTATETADCTATPVTGDYEPPTSPLTIDAGDATDTIEIETCADDLLEGHETLTVTLTEVTTTAGQVRVGSPSEATTTIGDGDFTVKVSLPAGTADTAEGDAAVFTVTLEPVAVASDVTVGYATEDGSAVAGSDYVPPVDATLTIAAGKTTGMITVQTLNDKLAEDTETFRVVLSLLNPPQDVQPGRMTATRNITDAGDAVTAAVTSPLNVPEGQPVTFTVTLMERTGSENVVVDYTVGAATDTATKGDDYQPPVGRLTIPAQTATGSIVIPTNNDNVNEAGETLTVSLNSVTSAGINLGSTELAAASSTTTIMPSDTVIVSVGDVTAVEGEPAIFTVTLSRALTQEIEVGYATANGPPGTDQAAPPGINDAVADGISGDYIAAGSLATLVIAAGQTSGTITIETVEDTISEADEAFTLTLSLPAPKPDKAELGIAQATATIIDDTLSVGLAGPATVVEGETADYTLTLTGEASGESVVVAYTIGGTATAEDHSGRDGTLTIPSGAETATLAIQTNDDDVLEGAETLVVTLTNATAGQSAVGGTPASALTTIEDNEDPVEVSVADPPTTVAEGRSATFTVTLSGKVSKDVIVQYATAPATATSADFTAASGTLTIAAGQTTGTITVETEADQTAEVADETFTLTLSEDPSQPLPNGVEIDTGAARATATITDLVLEASVTGLPSVPEGEAAVFTVALTGGTSRGDVVVGYTIGGTATAVEDYTQPNGTLTIPTGQASGTIVIQTIADGILDQGETLVVTLTGAETRPGLAELGTPIEVQTSIVDSGSVSVTGTAAPVEEGEPAVFTLTLSGRVGADVQVRYATADGTATAGNDYQSTSATATIPAGQTTVTFTVPTVEDDISEPIESFTVTLTGVGLPGGVTIDTRQVTAEILDDDTIIVTLTGPATVPEGEKATFTVNLTGGGEPVEVEYSVTGGDGATADDYTAPSGVQTLIIPAGARTASIEVQTTPDDVLDRGETLVVTLLAATARVADAEVGPQNQVTTTIVDSSTVTATVTAAPVEEGSPAVFTVTLTGKVAKDVAVGYETADGTATAGGTETDAADYRAASGTATVVAGQTTATFTVETVDDELIEEPETFTVTLTDVSRIEGVTLETRTVTATIDDDDELTASVVGPESVPEGNAARFALTLSQPVEVPVTVSYATKDGTATAGTDYEAADSSVEIAAGETTAMFMVNTLQDTLAEADETFSAMVTQLTLSLAFNTAPGTAATVMIVDDDKLTVSVTGPKTVVEGEVATYTVTLKGGTGSAAVAVDYSTDDSTATKDKDYTAPSGKLTIAAGATSARIAIETKEDKVVEPRETLVVKLTGAATVGTVTVGTPDKATTEILDPVYESINRVNQALLPAVARASAASTLDAVSRRMEWAVPGAAPMATADLAGLTGLYRALQANERALQDGSYDLAKVLGGSSFLVPLSSHEGSEEALDIGYAFWGSGDYRGISGGDPDKADVDWSGSAWSARIGADMRFIDSLLTGLAISWTGSALDYDDKTGGANMSGTYGSSLISVHPYVGWTTPDYGLWAAFGLGWGEVQIDDSVADAQSTGLSQWSLGGGASVTLLVTDAMIEGGTTALKVKADGFLSGATAEESEAKTIAELAVGVNQVRAAVEASHAQRFAEGGTLTPSLELGARLDGGDGEAGFGMEVGGGVGYADSGLAVEARGRALVLHGGNYGEWGLSGLVQYDPGVAGQGLMVSVRPTWGATANGVTGLWEHGTLDLLAGNEQAGGRVEAELGYGLTVFGLAEC